MDTTIVIDGVEVNVTIAWHTEASDHFTGFDITDIWVTHVEGVPVPREENGKYYDYVMTAEMDDYIRTNFL